MLRSARATFRLDTALGCVAVALLLQIVANFANDLSDFRRGADTPDRQGPLRVAAAGLVTERQLEVAIGIAIALAGVVGLWLAYVGGPVLLVLGLLAVVAALAYTGGPWPYGYRGLGEVFVFVFFGLVAVVGTAYLQAGSPRPPLLRRGNPARRTDHRDPRGQQPAGHPDRPGGRQAHAGGRPGAIEDARRVRGPARRVVPRAGAPAVGRVSGAVPKEATPALMPAVLLPLVTAPLALPLVRVVRGFGEPRELNLVLKGTARLAFAFSLLFAAGLALAGSAYGGPAA